jgi:hypothetical protein
MTGNATNAESSNGHRPSLLLSVSLNASLVGPDRPGSCHVIAARFIGSPGRIFASTRHIRNNAVLCRARDTRVYPVSTFGMPYPTKSRTCPFLIRHLKIRLSASISILSARTHLSAGKVRRWDKNGLNLSVPLVNPSPSFKIHQTR